MMVRDVMFFFAKVISDLIFWYIFGDTADKYPKIYDLRALRCKDALVALLTLFYW